MEHGGRDRLQSLELVSSLNGGEVLLQVEGDGVPVSRGGDAHAKAPGDLTEVHTVELGVELGRNFVP
jgi:hypothetical protein